MLYGCMSESLKVFDLIFAIVGLVCLFSCLSREDLGTLTQQILI